jgi:Cdc6-like AAA superfamily ATPase
VLRYINQPFDKIFAEVGTFPLRRSDVVDDVARRHVERPEAKAIFDAHNEAPDKRRDFPLAYVVGPIGSGKTFFALHYMKDFRNDSGLPSVLVYWQPWIWYKELDFAGDSAPRKLVERFFERMTWRIDSQYKRAWNPTDDKLNLHVCLVMDEADNREQKGFFEKRSMVTRFVQELEATQFATSLMVVVVGSIVDRSTDFDDAKDAHFFRMKDWSGDDVYRLQLKRMRPSDP